MSAKPTLHLIHGIPGSGKTTFARKLEQDLHAVRFSPDEWMVTLHGTNPPEPLFREQHERIMELIWEHVERVLKAGCDVVLDGGFWSRASRDDARRRSEKLGVACKFYALRCSVEEARRRVSARTKAMPPGTLEITEPTFDFLLGKLESLGADEECIEVPSDAVYTNS
ncbi:MAG: AAA family ATPase [Nibricoccus sp.]